MTSPLFAHDRKLIQNHSVLIGVDEAGRGPLAGPVVAAAVSTSRDFFEKFKRRKILSAFNDSKQISAETRLELFQWLEEKQEQGELCFSWAEASVGEIDKINILQATSLAMNRAVEGLPKDLLTTDPLAELPLFQEPGKQLPLILVDGKPVKALNYSHSAIVKGDGTSMTIAMASIVAKTIRDRMMVKLDKEYPAYGFAKHKGYGTKAHREAILEHGPSKVHRATFLRKILHDQ